MFEYFPYLIFLFLVIFILTTQKNRVKKSVFLILLLTLFSGLRFDVGHDYPSYYEAVINPVNGGASRFEPLIQKLIIFCSHIGSPALFFLSTSFIINALIVKTIEKRSSDYNMAIIAYVCLPFFFTEFLCIVRQAVAIAIVLYATKFLYKDFKNYIVFTVLVLIAMGNHITAGISFLMLFPFYRISAKIHAVLLLFCFVLGSGMNEIFGNSDLSILPIGEYYLRYLSQENVGEGGKMLLVFCLFAILNIFSMLKIEKTKESEYKMLSIVNVGFCIMFFFLFNHMLSFRVSRYFLMFIPLTFSTYLTMFKSYRRNKKLALTFCFLLFCVQLYIAKASFAADKYQRSYMPYETILFRDL